MNPAVSIVIPCRNEEKYIERCINSVLNSNYPKELITIYVCDGMSADKTREIIDTISKSNNQVILLDNKKQTTPYALNLGLKKSTDAIKIILGAHAEVHPDFVVENVKAFEVDIKIGCTGGVLENIYENYIAKIIGYGMSSEFGVGNAHFRTGNKSGFVDTVAFGAYKSEVFDSIGYFDEQLARNQDDEINFRLLKNGYKIYLSNKIHSKYYVRGSFKKLFKQYFQYGYWKVFVNKKHSTITSFRQLVPLLFVLYLIIGLLSSLVFNVLVIPFVAGITLYLLLAIRYALIQTKKLREIALTIVTFFILHFSYGLGYLKGLLWFILLNKQPTKQSESLSR